MKRKGPTKVTVTSDAMFQAVMDNPGEPDRKLVFADWLLDQDGDADVLKACASLARAYRWMAWRGKHPHHRTHYHYHHQPPRRVPARYGWAWYPVWADHRKRSLERIHDASCLPRLTYLAVTNNREHSLYGSFDDAVLDLADSLDRVEQELRTG
jgi:uncharacterized protein (TIGR02996 family)